MRADPAHALDARPLSVQPRTVELHIPLSRGLLLALLRTAPERGLLLSGDHVMGMRLVKTLVALRVAAR